MRSLKLDKIQQIFLSTLHAYSEADSSRRQQTEAPLSRYPHLGQGVGLRAAEVAALLPAPRRVLRGQPEHRRRRGRGRAQPRLHGLRGRAVGLRGVKHLAPHLDQSEVSMWSRDQLSPPITAHLQPIAGRLHLGPGGGVSHSGSVQIQTWADILCQVGIRISTPYPH